MMINSLCNTRTLPIVYEPVQESRGGRLPELCVSLEGAKGVPRNGGRK